MVLDLRAAADRVLHGYAENTHKSKPTLGGRTSALFYEPGQDMGRPKDGEVTESADRVFQSPSGFVVLFSVGTTAKFFVGGRVL